MISSLELYLFTGEKIQNSDIDSRDLISISHLVLDHRKTSGLVVHLAVTRSPVNH